MNRILLFSHLFKTQKDIWDILQVISAVLIPVVIGLASYWIQKSIAKQSVAKDYVAIATTILEKPKQEGDDALREWATKLLVRYSPEPFSPKAQEQLESEGLTQALTVLGRGQLQPNEKLVATCPSPDGKKEAMIKAYEMKGWPWLEVYDSATGFEIFRSSDIRGSGSPTLVWSQDGLRLAVSYNLSGTARITVFDIPQKADYAPSPNNTVTPKPPETYETTGLGSGTESLHFSEDGRSLILKKTDGTTEKRPLP